MKVTREHTVGIVCIIIAVTILLITPSFPAGQEGANLTGPAFFPNVLAIAYILLGGLQLFLAFKSKPKRNNNNIKQSSKKDPQQLKRIITTLEYIALMVGFFAFFKPLGFIISTILFLFLLMWLLGVKWWKSLLISLVYTAIIYLLFGMLFTIGLPAGILSVVGL
ncbi:MAG: tripartite tricarboxylate transporter TctB family protein [Rectinema sp.]